MDNSLWITMLIISIGTYLMRALPLLWMSRRIKRNNSGNVVENMPIWLSVLGSTMIAAMFGVSLVPSTLSTIYWSATILATSTTIVFWYWKRSLGLPVFAGVMMYGIAIYSGSLF